MIVDFTSTTFIDSTTLGVLVGGVKRLRPNDGRLSLVCSDREHRQDLRDHGARPRLRRSTGRATRPSSKLDGRHSTVVLDPEERSSHSPSRCWRSSRRAAAPSAASPRAMPSHGKQLFLQSAKPSEPSCASCHTLADAKSQGTIGPNLDDAFASVKTQGVLGGADDPRRRPRPDRLPGGADAGEPRTAARTRATSRVYIAQVRRQPELRRHRDDRRRARRDDDDHRRRGGGGGGGCARTARQVFALGRLRRLPHAEGRRLERQRRPEPRPAEAGRGDGRSTRSRSAAARCRRSRASSRDAEIKAVAKYVSSVAGK